jgi:hypothetical protein
MEIIEFLQTFKNLVDRTFRGGFSAGKRFKNPRWTQWRVARRSECGEIVPRAAG